MGSVIKVYTDGSYDENREVKVTGASIVIIDDKVTSIYRFMNEDGSLNQHRQYAGELLSALYVLEVLAKAFEGATPDVDVIQVYHDYTGVADWMNGSWKKPKNDVSRCYKVRGLEALSKLRYSGVPVEFVNVRAHTGNRYNELVDSVAAGTFPTQYAEEFGGNILFTMTAGNATYRR